MHTLDDDALSELRGLSLLSSEEDVKQALAKAAGGVDWRTWHKWRTGAFPASDAGEILYSLAGVGGRERARSLPPTPARSYTASLATQTAKHTS
jgi:hypothetical protein